MSDEIEVPPTMFTPAETPILPAGLVTITPFTNVIYPTQLAAPAIIGKAGELRGFYANDRWKPKWSGFMYPRSPTKKHGGVDIFAPRNTPIVAIVDGEAEHRTSPDDMGLRVHLKFSFAGVDYRFILGHLDRFEGGKRVTKGMVIGYAGCSGNAAGAQPCLTPNDCGKFSTHLHLQLKRDVDGKLLDPLKALGWSLAYEDDARDVACRDA